jgi:hypothetical protein
MMLSRMGMTRIIKWCKFNGGRLARKEHTTMLSCTKTISKEGGNAT